MKEDKKTIITLILSLLIVLGAGFVFSQTYNEWTFPTSYNIGDVVVYNGLYYEVLQSHTSQGHWKPNEATSLYKQIDITPCDKPSFCVNIFYFEGEIINYESVSYYVLQTHKSQSDWTPDVAVSLFSPILSYEDGKPVLKFGNVKIEYENNFVVNQNDLKGFEITHRPNNINIKLDSENYPNLNKPVNVAINNTRFNNVIKPKLYRITYENKTFQEPIYSEELNENGTYSQIITGYNEVVKLQRIRTEINTPINVYDEKVNFELDGFSEYDLTDGLVSYWKFDETTGTNVRDFVSGNNGTANNARVLNADGLINKAVDFTQGNDYIELSSFSGLKTWSFWVYNTQDFTSNGLITSNLVGSRSIFPYVWLGGFSSAVADELLSIPQSSSFGTGWWWSFNSVLGGSTLSSGWHHFVIYWNSSDSFYYLSYNGGTPVKATKRGSATEINNFANPNIGGYSDSGYSNYIRIDEMAYWNNTLNSTEMVFLISSLYNEGAGFQYPFEINVSVKQPFQNFTLDKTKTAVTSNDLNFYPYLGSPYFDNVFRFEDYNLFEINFTDPYNNQTKNFNFTYDTETNQFYNDRATDSENGSIVFELVSSSGVNAGKGYMQIYTTNKYEGDILFNYRLTNNYGGNYNDTFKITLKPYFSYINEAMSPELNFSYFGEYLFQLDVLIRLLGLNNLNLGMYAENTSLSITGLNANDSNCWNYYLNGTCASSIITSNLTQNLSSLYQSKILYPDDLYNEVFFTDSNLTWNYEKNDYIVTSTDIHVFNFSNPFSMVENTSLYLEFYTEPVSNITSFDLQVYLVSKDVTDLNTFFSGTWRTSNQTQLVDVVTRTETPHHEHTNLSKHYLTALLTNENGEIGSLDLNNSFYMVLTTSNPSEPRGWNLKYLNNTICNNTGEWLFKDGLNNFINPDGCPDVHFHLARRNTDYRDGVNITMTTEFENYNDTNTEIFYFLEFEIFPPNPTSFLNPLDNDTITTRNILVNWESVIHPSNLDFVYELYFNETLINTTTITSYILDTINYENDIPYNLTITIRDSLNQTANTKITITLNRIYGCTNPLAQNYDENAVIDDGSCLAGGLTLEQLDEYYEEKKEEAIYMIAIIVFSIVGLVWAYFVSTLYGGVIVSAMGLLGLFNDFSVTISTILIFLGIMIIMSNKEKLKDGL